MLQLQKMLLPPGYFDLLRGAPSLSRGYLGTCRIMVRLPAPIRATRTKNPIGVTTQAKHEAVFAADSK